MLDMATGIDIRPAVAPRSWSVSTVSAVVDRQGFESLTVAISVGIGGISFDASNRIDFRLVHSDDGLAFDPVVTDHLLGCNASVTGVIKSLSAPHPSSECAKVGYIGNRRYVQLLVDFIGNHATGTGISAAIILGDPWF